MSKGKYYSEIEDFCITHFYNKIDIELLVSALGRTKGSIRFRANRLGVANPVIRLSKEQKKFIDENKNRLTQQTIADKLGIKRDSVAWHILYSKKDSNG